MSSKRYLTTIRPEQVDVSRFKLRSYVQVVRIFDSRKCLERREGVEVPVGTEYPRYKRLN